MQITIKTLELTINHRTTTLTKAIAKQFAWFDPSDYTKDDINTKISVIGEVDLCDSLYVLINTPHGIQKIGSVHFINGYMDRTFGVSQLERIILL